LNPNIRELTPGAEVNDVSSDSRIREIRSKAPVFVLGSPRSGTTLLYHMLLSAGNFAVYRAESQVLHLLEPRFGDLSISRNKKRLMQSWCKTRLFTETGLDAGPLEERIMAECRNGGDFLRIVMEEVARRQGVERWAECTPDHILYLERIKETIPNALIIHMVRDGRDVALSMEKLGYPRQLPWDRRPRRMAAGLYWEWIVQRGREHGRHLGQDYIEVHYEDLVATPQRVLDRLTPFVAQVLDYEQIRKVGIGSVSKPNTSFEAESQGDSFGPVGRWKKRCSAEQITMLDDLLSTGLHEFGYSRRAGGENRRLNLQILRAQYRTFFNAKLYARTRTPVGRLFVTRDLSWI
jgi:hypothetical protein